IQACCLPPSWKPHHHETTTRSPYPGMMDRRSLDRVIFTRDEAMTRAITGAPSREFDGEEDNISYEERYNSPRGQRRAGKISRFKSDGTSNHRARRGSDDKAELAPERVRRKGSLPRVGSGWSVRSVRRDLSPIVFIDSLGFNGVDLGALTNDDKSVQLSQVPLSHHHGGLVVISWEWPIEHRDTAAFEILKKCRDFGFEFAFIDKFSIQVANLDTTEIIRFSNLYTYLPCFLNVLCRTNGIVSVNRPYLMRAWTLFEFSFAMQKNRSLTVKHLFMPCFDAEEQLEEWLDSNKLIALSMCEHLVSMAGLKPKQDFIHIGAAHMQDCRSLGVKETISTLLVQDLIADHGHALTPIINVIMLMLRSPTAIYQVTDIRAMMAVCVGDETVVEVHSHPIVQTLIECLSMLDVNEWDAPASFLNAIGSSKFLIEQNLFVMAWQPTCLQLTLDEDFSFRVALNADGRTSVVLDPSGFPGPPPFEDPLPHLPRLDPK
ncbi:MAG TPA: hypothetical protein VEF04_02955, partial [Blastocatellia bacterium]|nr:hypothetical protein [Blastocatellia bacterium]